jgi:hypothetical protein
VGRAGAFVVPVNVVVGATGTTTVGTRVRTDSLVVVGGLVGAIGEVTTGGARAGAMLEVGELVGEVGEVTTTGASTGAGVELVKGGEGVLVVPLLVIRSVMKDGAHDASVLFPSKQRQVGIVRPLLSTLV